MKVEIYVYKDDRSCKDKLTKKEMEKILRVFCKENGVKQKHIFLNVTFCNRKSMVYLNKKTRNENHATNVLSYEPKNKSALENLIKNGFINSEYCNSYVGDLVFCPEVVKEEAETLKISMKERYYLLFTHGLCHLFGYDHKTPKEEKIMTELEEKVLLHFGIKDPYWYNIYNVIEE